MRINRVEHHQGLRSITVIGNITACHHLRFACALKERLGRPQTWTTSSEKRANLRPGVSLELVILLNLRFTAEFAAPVGSSCQSRLCSSARRIPHNRAVLASAPCGSAALQGLTAPPCALLPPTVKRMFFIGLQRPNSRHQRRQGQCLTLLMICSAGGKFHS